MKYTTNDIKDMSHFAESLSNTCREILNGVPKSRALEKNNISYTTFYTVLRGLRMEDAATRNAEKASSMDDLRHPVWQDALLEDICGSEEAYLPEDFEDELYALEKRYMKEDDASLINRLYIDGMSISEIAEERKCSEPPLRTKKNRALKILRAHKNELVLGKSYIDKYDELVKLNSEHLNQLEWMTRAISYLKKLSKESLEKIRDAGITEDAKNFYEHNGFYYLADIIGVDFEKLFVAINTEMNDRQTFLAVSGDKGVSPDTSLSELGFKENIITAFHSAGYYKVGDILKLDETQVRSIPGIGLKQIVHLYRRVIFG